MGLREPGNSGLGGHQAERYTGLGELWGHQTGGDSRLGEPGDARLGGVGTRLQKLEGHQAEGARRHRAEG